jgi:uncharacterized delta-60 repeat protein
MAWAQSADTFNPGATSSQSPTVYAVAKQGDGKILIGGDFTQIDGQNHFHIARLNADGTVDSSFNSNADSTVNSIAIQADGKIVVGGFFGFLNGQNYNQIGRLNADGTLDSAFHPFVGGNPSYSIYAVAAQADGKILVGGSFTLLNGQTRNNIGRLNADGTLDTAFHPQALNSAPNQVFVYGFALQTDGKILVGGQFNSLGGEFRDGIGRLNSDGTLDTSFNPGPTNGVIRIFSLQVDGKILVGGSFEQLGGQPRISMGRLNADGTLDTAFDPGLTDIGFIGIYAVVVQPDSKIIVGGTFTQIGGQERNGLARLNADGTLDTSFSPQPGGTATVRGLAVQADGKIILGGRFSQLNGQPRNSIGRLNADGTLDSTFNLTLLNSLSASINAVTVQGDNKILVGGFFLQLGGQARSGIGRLNTDGTLDLPYPETSQFGEVNAVAIQEDGKVILGGPFSQVGGEPRNHIGRINAEGTVDTTFNPGAGFTINAIARQPDGKILVGGYFTQLAGQPRNRIGRLNSDGTLDVSFNPGAGGPGTFVSPAVLALALQPDGKIVVGGYFEQLGGKARSRIGRLNSDGTLDTSFDPGIGGSSTSISVQTIAVQADGKILVGGLFSQLDGQPRDNMGRLNADGTLDTSFNQGAVDSTVRTIAIQPDDKIVVGGDFTQIGGQGREHIARLETNGTVDLLFNAGVSGSLTSDPTGVYTLAVQADGRILVGGNFTHLAGQPRNNIGRLDPNGQPSPTPTPTPTPTASPTPPATPTPTPTVAPSATPTPVPGRLGNISTRLRVETGDNVLIGGFIVSGTQPKRVILRAIGPSLTSVGVPDALTNPTLELHGPGGFTTVTNDNWMDAPNRQEIIDSGLAPTNTAESAILATLPSNNSAYTAIVRGVNNGTGVGLVEAYDLNPTADSKLANISTRGFVQAGDNVMIGGFIVVGQTSTRVIVRAIGPSLPLQDKLANPTLELRDSNGTLLQSNDNWRTGGQEADIIATGLQPSNDLESAIIRTLVPGATTAIVRGVNGTTGVALVEVYDLGPP